MNWKRFFNILIPTVLFLWGAYCMLKSYGYASEYDYQIYLEKSVPLEKEYLYQYPPSKHKVGKWVNPYEHVWSKDPRIIIKQKAEQIQEWKDNFDFHMLNAIRTYEDAKNRVWWLPDVSWRQRGREAWVAAFSTVGAQTVQLKLIVAVSSLLCQYGLDCLDEWEYIENKLYWSEYHLKECAKYAALLNGQ